VRSQGDEVEPSSMSVTGRMCPLGDEDGGNRPPFSNVVTGRLIPKLTSRLQLQSRSRRTKPVHKTKCLSVHRRKIFLGLSDPYPHPYKLRENRHEFLSTDIPPAPPNVTSRMSWNGQESAQRREGPLLSLRLLLVLVSPGRMYSASGVTTAEARPYAWCTSSSRLKTWGKSVRADHRASCSSSQ
jgi:hypothetical protein